MAKYARSAKSILASLKERLEENGFDTSNASINVVFADAISKELAPMYEMLEESDRQRKVSSATDMSLDTLGQERNLPRLPGEDDDNYRYRIAGQENTLTSSNDTALRLALLTLDSIVDADFVPYVQGPGSGLIVLMTQDPFADTSVIEEAKERVGKLSAWGNRYSYVIPSPVVVSIEVKTILHGNLSKKESADVTEMLRLRTEEFLSTIRPGKPFFASQLVGFLFESPFTASVSDPVKDIQVVSLKVNSQPHDTEIVQVKPFERIVADTSSLGVIIR